MSGYQASGWATGSRFQSALIAAVGLASGGLYSLLLVFELEVCHGARSCGSRDRPGEAPGRLSSFALETIYGCGVVLSLEDGPLIPPPSQLGFRFPLRWFISHRIRCLVAGLSSVCPRGRRAWLSVMRNRGAAVVRLRRAFIPDAFMVVAPYL